MSTWRLPRRAQLHRRQRPQLWGQRSPVCLRGSPGRTRVWLQRLQPHQDASLRQLDTWSLWLSPASSSPTENWANSEDRLASLAMGNSSAFGVGEKAETPAKQILKSSFWLCKSALLHKIYVLLCWFFFFHSHYIPTFCCLYFIVNLNSNKILWKCLWEKSMCPVLSFFSLTEDRLSLLQETGVCTKQRFDSWTHAHIHTRVHGKRLSEPFRPLLQCFCNPRAQGIM